jgi:hypothetical protein
MAIRARPDPVDAGTCGTLLNMNEVFGAEILAAFQTHEHRLRLEFCALPLT